MKKTLFPLLLSFLLAFVVISCKKNDLLNNSSKDLNKGTFSLALTANSKSTLNYTLNKKPEDVTSLIITINQLEIHKTSNFEAGWHTITIDETTIDLMSLGAIEKIIASAEISDGNYNQIRFKVDSAQVATESGEYDAEVPSGKIKINVSFTVHKDGSTEVTISIDPKASLKISGNKDNPKYKLSPVIHLIGVDED
jgi:hypothetical protein